MTVGEHIKKGAESTKDVTDKVVDAVEGTINRVTDTVENAVKRAGDKVNGAATSDRIETAEDDLEEKIANDSLNDIGLLPLPDAVPTDGPAPAP